jgi:hypothetical protein
MSSNTRDARFKHLASFPYDATNMIGSDLMRAAPAQDSPVYRIERMDSSRLTLSNLMDIVSGFHFADPAAARATCRIDGIEYREALRIDENGDLTLTKPIMLRMHLYDFIQLVVNQRLADDVTVFGWVVCTRTHEAIEAAWTDEGFVTDHFA